MSTSATDTRAIDVRATHERLIVRLADDREVSVPLAWFPRLLTATPEQRNNWSLIGGGIGIHWPDVDEDISVEGLLHPEATLKSRR